MASLVSFFAGVGGIDLGFRAQGFDVLGAFDFDKYAVETYRANVGPEIQQRDIRQMTGSEIPEADVWSFGFPCTDLSISGKRAGLHGERSGLFFEVMRLLDEVEARPRYLVAENVAGVVPFLPEIEAAYAERGYQLVTKRCHATQFGLPQNRERYALIGVHEGETEPVLEDPKPLPYYPRLIDFFDREVPEKYYRRRPAFRVREDALERLVKHDRKPVAVADAYASSHQNSKLHHPLGISPAIICSTDTKVWLGYNCWRLLTPAECGRLQGFPVDHGWKQVVSDAQAYKQFGNAVPVPMFAHVAGALASAMRSSS